LETNFHDVMTMKIDVKIAKTGCIILRRIKKLELGSRSALSPSAKDSVGKIVSPRAVIAPVIPRMTTRITKPVNAPRDFGSLSSTAFFESSAYQATNDKLA